MNTPLIKWPSNGAVLLVHNGDPLHADQLALEYVKKWLFEENASNEAHQNALFESRTHPDFYSLTLEEGAKWIKIDQIRAFNQWTTTTPSIAARHAAIITPAHQLNMQAANALLKTLEEIPSNTLLILVTDKPSLLPATIRSRCYWIRLRESPTAENDLAPMQTVKQDLKGLTLGSLNFVSIADQWAEQDPKKVIAIVWQILVERTLTSAKKGEITGNPRWWGMLDRVLQAKRELEEPNQPNILLLLESLLIEYLNASRGAQINRT